MFVAVPRLNQYIPQLQYMRRIVEICVPAQTQMGWKIEERFMDVSLVCQLHVCSLLRGIIRCSKIILNNTYDNFRTMNIFPITSIICVANILKFCLKDFISIKIKHFFCTLIMFSPPVIQQCVFRKMQKD